MPGFVPGFLFLVSVLFCDDRKFAIWLPGQALGLHHSADVRWTAVSSRENASVSSLDSRGTNAGLQTRYFKSPPLQRRPF